MGKEEIYQLIIEKIIQCFTPSEQELQIIEDRLQHYDNEELQHLLTNFTTFGVDAVIECMYSTKFGGIPNLRRNKNGR